MGIFSLKWLLLFIFVFASMILYNYGVVHQLGSFSHPIFWAISRWISLQPDPRYLSPMMHIRRRPELRRYKMVLQTDIRWPGGVQKTVITVNGTRSSPRISVHCKDEMHSAGQFPGPTIEVRSGDTLEVTVKNNLPYKEGTSLHWHGLRMKGKSAWYFLFTLIFIYINWMHHLVKEITPKMGHQALLR